MIWLAYLMCAVAVVLLVAAVWTERGTRAIRRRMAAQATEQSDE